MTGVDVHAQPRYPFAFHQGGALAWLEHYLAYGGWPDGGTYDFVHASFPCQDYSRALRHLSARQARLVDAGRSLLEQTDLPWVMENVPGAPIASQPTLDGRYGIELCGTQFGLRVSRHRLFESSVSLVSPMASCRCSDTAILNPYNANSRKRDGIERGAEATYAEAMGVGWMKGKRGDLKSEIGEAIPPAYTEFIGTQLIAIVNQRAAA